MSGAPIKPGQEDMTFGDIVWGQFKKNYFAYGALWLIGVMFILAVFSPVIASGRAFIWTENGVTHYPWLNSLFDDNYYENGVDKFFNLLLIFGCPLFLLWCGVTRYVYGGLSKRIRRAKMRRLAGVLFLVFMGSFLWVMMTSEGSKNLHNYEDYLAAQEKGSDVSAVFAPVQMMYTQQKLKDKLQEPSFMGDCAEQGRDAETCEDYTLGTDSLGRSVAVRMLYGIRISLSVGVIAVGIYVTIGIILGAFAGYFRGRIDMLIQRLIEIFMAVPTLIVLMVVVSFIDEPSIFHIMLAIGLLRWTGVARLVRGEFLRLRNLDFVTSAIALGYSTRRVIFQHILPNALGPVLVAAAFGVAAAILIESSLSFLGLGDINIPSWGQMLRDGYLTQKMHLILIPGMGIFVTVTLLNLVGEGLRDALDPKMRK